MKMFEFTFLKPVIYRTLLLRNHDVYIPPNPVVLYLEFVFLRTLLFCT